MDIDPRPIGGAAFCLVVGHDVSSDLAASR
jgi:hypothetical protein